MDNLDIYGNPDESQSLDGTIQDNAGLDTLTDAEKSVLASALGIDLTALATNIQGDIYDWQTALDTPSGAGDTGDTGDVNGN